MLSEPKNGWCNITVRDVKGREYCDRASYLTDVHKDLLESAIKALKEGDDLYVEFDAEGWEWSIQSNNYSTFVTSNYQISEKTIELCVSKQTLIGEIYDDISSNLDAWSWWSTYVDSEKEAREEMRILKKLLHDIKILQPN